MAKNNFYFPNYKGKSILNLISSICKAYNIKTKYPPLKLLKPEEIKKTKNIVIILIDGLGYEYLTKNQKNSTLKNFLKGKITSVFPSATTSAIPSFFTGDSCKIHSMVSWHSFLKEFGCMIIPLPYHTRIKPRISLGEIKNIKEVFNLEPINNKIKVKPYVLFEKKLTKTDFSLAISGKKSKIIGYENEKDYFKKITKLIKSNKRKKYIFAYYGEYDKLCHEHGVKSKKVKQNFKKIDKEFKKFINSIKGTDSKIIITSDHGQIDVPKNKKIKIKNHPELDETLALPICGDNRYAFCFVKASKKRQFESYVNNKLKKYCKLYNSENLVKKGVFGLEKPTSKFLERIGDYVLIMKKNYGIYQKLVNEKEKYNIGEHGGLSKEEMFVPLIIVDSKNKNIKT